MALEEQPNWKQPLHEFRAWIFRERVPGSQSDYTAGLDDFVPAGEVEEYLRQPGKLREILSALFGDGDDVIDAQQLVDRYSVVFAILVAIDYGAYIGRFLPHESLRDARLPFDDRPRTFPDQGVSDTFFQRFRIEQARFCASKIYEGNHKFEREERLPFLEKKLVGEGGSAKVYRVKIHANHDFLSKPESPPGSRERHKFYALKAYEGDDGEKWHRTETATFRKLPRTGLRDAHIIGYHCSFEHRGVCYALLEYADLDTLEHFMMRQSNGPPSTDTEILSFWENLLHVIQAIGEIHELDPHKPYATKSGKFTSIHQDIKPTNILVKTKEHASSIYDSALGLADLGTSSLMKAGSHLMARDNFGTKTYGSPECFRRDSIDDGRNIIITTKADIWSFGCVLSEVCIWVVFGSSGPHGLNSYRQRRQKHNSEVRRGANTFHFSGRESQAVLDEHAKVAAQTRCDPITAAILQLMPKMLHLDPERRPSAQELRKHFNEIIKDARARVGLGGFSSVDKIWDPATSQGTDPSRATKDSGYGSYESDSIVQEVIEEQKEASDVQSYRTLSSFVDLGHGGRLRGVNIFASDLAQNLSPDIPEIVARYEIVVLAVQDALRVYSYSLEQQNRPDKLSDERNATHFVRQQSHDIAVKVVDYFARAQSTESGEATPEASMFAEPISVLSWVDSNSNAVADSPSGTAEVLDETAVDESSGRGSSQLDETIMRMRGFLSDNATFEWLKHRVQAVMSISGGGELTPMSKKLSNILKQNFSGANDHHFMYTIDWNPLEFMLYNYTGYVDVASVISINSDGQALEACTVGEYIARVWPATGPRFLEAVRSWWKHVSDGREEESLQHSLLDGWVTFTRQSSVVHVDIAGPMFLRLETGEQLVWLASICRKGMFPDQLTSFSASISQGGSKSVINSGTIVNITFSFEKFAQDGHSADDWCWLKLFRNCCVANGVSVNIRQEEEKGLEIPFSLMATLGGFDRVADYAGQLVLKGFETLFVPMKKIGGSITWHLVTKPNGRRISYNAMFALSGQPDATVCMQDLFDSRHFLGWVSNASQLAGTKDGVYDLDNEVFLDPPGQGLVLSGIAISMSKIVGISATITTGRQDRGIRTSSKEMFYLDVVDKMSKMHVLLYDHGDGRGWLVDGASAVLHLLRFHVARYRPICDGEKFTLEQFQYADSAVGVKSARKVLVSREMREIVLVEEPSLESEKQVTETVDGITTVKTVVERLKKRKTVEDRVRDLYEILELMYDSWKRRKTTPGIALESLNMKLEGWKFQDVVELENDMNPVVANLDGSADDWLRMVRHVNAVVLIGNGFGDMMKPIGDFCSNLGSVPQKQFCVAVPVSRLERIARKYGDPKMIPIKLTPDVFWPINQHPFVCSCASASGRSTCHRGQSLRSNSLRRGCLQLSVLTAAEHANGAVIFEGRRSVRDIAQIVTDQSPEHSKRPVRPAWLAWLRNVRDRFRSKKENGRDPPAAA